MKYNGQSLLFNSRRKESHERRKRYFLELTYYSTPVTRHPRLLDTSTRTGYSLQASARDEFKMASHVFEFRTWHCEP